MITKSMIPKRKWKRLLKRTCFILMIMALLITNVSIPANAAITTGNSTNANSGTGLSVTLNKPGGTVAGDVLVACIVATSALATEPEVTPPEGWQLIRTTNAYQGLYYDMVTYYKVAGANEPASYTWNSTHHNASGGITRLTGVDINHVVDASADNQGQGTSPTSATAPSVTTNYTYDIVLNFFGSYSPLSSIDEPLLVAPPLNQLYEYLPPLSGAYAPPSIAAYSWIKDLTGATGNRSCTLTSGISTVRWVTQTIAFKAAPRAYFPVASTSANEDDSNRSFQVNLAPNALGPVEINFTVGGTAKLGTDYIMTTTSPVTVNTGAGSASIGFKVLEDNLYEDNETIIITLNSGQEYILSGNTQYTHTINNDDTTAPSPVITALSSSSGLSPAVFPASMSISISKPEGTTSGDFMLASLVIKGASDVKISGMNPSGGWTPVKHTYVNGVHIFTYYRIANSADSSISTYTWSYTTYASNDYSAVGGITRYRGVDIVEPVDEITEASGVASEIGITNYTFATAPAIWPNNTNNRIVTIFGTKEHLEPTGTGGAFSTPTGMSQLYEGTYFAYTSGGPTAWPSVGAFDMNYLPASGWGIAPDQKTTSIHLIDNISSVQWCAQTIALKTSRLSISDMSIAEGDNGESSTANFTVSLDHPTNVPVTFKWLTANGTATAGSDYVLSGEDVVTIPAGSTSHTFGVPITGDLTLESDETFYVNITNVTGATVEDSQGEGLIKNDDSSITINDVSLNEGNAGTTNFNFTVNLTPACSLPVSVNYTIIGEGTATQNVDYTYTLGTLEIAAGQTSNTISIPVIGDTDFEPNETFTVFLSQENNAHITDSRGIGTILNDDVQLPNLSINDVSLTEGNSGSSNLVFTVTISAVSTSNISANYATANGTASAGSDYTASSGTLNISSGQTTGTISVPIIGDTIFEPNETFYVNLTNVSGAVISDNQGIGTILNDDVLGTAPVISDNPDVQVITYGSNTSFTSSATGTPLPTIKWQVSTDGGASFSDIIEGGIYSGVTSNTLNLTRPPVSYSGYKYRAVFTNGISPDALSNVAVLTVDPLGITGNFTAENKVYDGTTAATVLSQSLTGVLSGDTVSLTGGTAAFDNKNVGTGKTVTLSGSTLSGTDAGNYSLTSVATTTADITAKEVAPSIIANDKQYDGTTEATLSSQGVTGVISPDDVTLVVGKADFASKNVGTWTVTATTLSLGGADAGNYTLSALSAEDTADITAINLTIKGATAIDKEYDGNNTVTVDFSEAVLEGDVSTDDVSIDSSGYTATFDNKNVGTSKPVTVMGVTLSGTDAANYTISQPAGLTADITALGITGSFTAENKVYDGTTAATVLSQSLTGVLSGDTVSLTGGTAAFDNKNVGTGKTVTLSGSTLSGTDAGNYSLTSVTTTTADITAKEVAPSIIANDKQYDGTTEATLSSQGVTGVISPDDVTLVVGKADFASKNVGTWTVTATTLSLGGADAGNYTLSALSAEDTADITAINLTIKGATAVDKEYDGNNTVTVDFTEAVLEGDVSTDDVSIDSSGYTATFDNKNVGTSKPVTVMGVTLSGTDAANYTISQPAGLTADITALGITGSFTAENKVYDGTTAAKILSQALTGVLSGDTVSLTGGTAAFDSKNVGTGKTVTLSGSTLSGTDAGNYSLTSVTTTTADITIREIEVTAVADIKTYDGSTDSDKIPVITSALGLATGDSANWTQTFDTKDAGSSKILTPTGNVNDGNGGNNYNVTFIPVSTGVIEKATITVTAEDKSSQYSDSRLPFTASYSGFISGETLSTSGVTGSPSYITLPELSNPILEPPGEYDIVPELGTLKADNYKFAFVNGTYKVTEEEATITFDSKNTISIIVSSDGGDNSAFTWKAIISQDNDGKLGDLSNIKPSDITLSFSAVGGGGGWSDKASSFDPDTGIASFNVPKDVLAVETYAALVTFTSNYFIETQAEDVLVVYDPSLGFTTGGGWFYWPDGTNNPDLEGVKTNFGYTMKYNRKGTSVQGSFLLIAHLEDGSIVRLKSNAVNGMAIIENTYPGIASFSGKCVYSRVDAYGNKIAEAGNQEFIVYAKDMNEPGTGNDMLWFTTKLTLDDEDPFSLDCNDDNLVDENEYVTIGGGNIIVPHTSNKSEVEEPVEDVDDSDEVDGTIPPGKDKKK